MRRLILLLIIVAATVAQGQVGGNGISSGGSSSGGNSGVVTQADWNATTGASTILNKPSPGTAASQIGVIANADITANSAAFYSDGTQIYSAGPAYASFGTFIDDFTLAVMSNPTAFPTANKLNILNKILAGKNGNGELPATIEANGTPIYYSALDAHHAYAAGDGWIMGVQLMNEICKDYGIGSAKCTALYSANVATFKTAMAFFPKSGSGLPTVVLGNEYVAGTLFQEYMRLSGDITGASVWFAIDSKVLAALATAAGDSTNATFFNTQYANTVAAIQSEMIDPTTGMLIAATGQCSTNLDIASSVIADYWGLLTTPQNTRIETYITTNYASLVNANGYIIQTPGGWAIIGTIPVGGAAPYGSTGFTNTQYQGGYWTFFFREFAYALNKANTVPGAPGKVGALLTAYATGVDPQQEYFNVGSAVGNGTTPNLESPQGPLWAASNYPMFVQPAGNFMLASGVAGGGVPVAKTAAGTVNLPFELTYDGGTNNTVVNYTSANPINTALFVSNTSSGGHSWADLVVGTNSGTASGYRCWLDATTGYIPFCYLTTSTLSAMRFPTGAIIQWDTTNSALTNVVDTGISRASAGVVSIDDGSGGASGKGKLLLAAITPGLLYSAAGTALPSCAVGIKGQDATVSDATAPTYMGAYASGGAITAKVICSFNGTTFSWLTH